MKYNRKGVKVTEVLPCFNLAQLLLERKGKRGGTLKGPIILHV